jgi:hypothetical protein
VLCRRSRRRSTVCPALSDGGPDVAGGDGAGGGGSNATAGGSGDGSGSRRPEFIAEVPAPQPLSRLPSPSSGKPLLPPRGKKSSEASTEGNKRTEKKCPTEPGRLGVGLQWILEAVSAIVGTRGRAEGVEIDAAAKGGSDTLKACGNAGTPDAYSQPVSAAGVNVGVAAPPHSAAHRRAKSPTASNYDSRWQAAPMYGKSAQRRS